LSPREHEAIANALSPDPLPVFARD